MTLRQERFLKTQKALYLKIKTCSSKDTIKRAKTKAKEWEKTFAIHLKQNESYPEYICNFNK